MRWRWQLEKRPGDPWDNMARDTALLAALRDGQALVPTIRLYRWDRPAVSFGRLQQEEAVRQLYPGLPRVRRPTGGRAVLHGQDLTVTIAALVNSLPGEQGKGIIGSYWSILAGIVAALHTVGISADFGGCKSARSSRNVVNCFDVAVGCDLIDPRTGHKILGSAQRREGKAILQQMSLPLAILPDGEEFLRILKGAFQDVLQIEGWLTIDTPDMVGYTEYEKSEGVYPWRVKS